MKKSFVILFLTLLLISAMSFQLRTRGEDDKEKEDAGNKTSKWPYTLFEVFMFFSVLVHKYILTWLYYRNKVNRRTMRMLVHLW